MARPKGKNYEFEMFFGLGEKLTEEQEKMIELIFKHKIVFVDSRAGTGKTTIAVGVARQLNAMYGMEAVYICSPINTKVMGYLPGSLEEKLAVYKQPLVDALLEINENPQQAIFVQNVDEFGGKSANQYAWVHFESPTFYRGINLKSKVVIIDEMQNFTKAELKKILTRIDDNSKVICIGHRLQCDLHNPNDSGFVPYQEWFRGFNDVGYVTLTKNFRGELSQWADECPI